jgi:hypothetical protein
MSESSPPAAGNGRALIPVGPKGVELRDVDAMFRFAKCYMQSGLAPSSFRNEQQLVIVWAKAAELGLSPLQAVEGMSVINNRVGIMGDLALAMVEASGELEQKRVEYSGEGDSLQCKVTLQRRSREAQSYSFSVKEAKAAGIYERSFTWKGYPRRMCYYRALGFALRDEFADVLKGIKTVEELMDYPAQEENQRARRQPKVVRRAPEEKKAPLGGVNDAPESKALVKVRARLEESKISESEFLDILKAAQIPEAQSAISLESISDKPLSLALESWDTVVVLAEELRTRRTEAAQ